MHTRIKMVRKALGMTQDEFGKVLGLKRNSVAQIEGGRATSSQTVFSICREFNVNEEWLKTGHGQMFNEKEMTELEKIVTSHGLVPEYAEVMEYLLKLPPDSQKAVVNLVMDLTKVISQKEPITENDPQRAARLLREEADAVEQGGGVSSALPFTDDTESDCG